MKPMKTRGQVMNCLSFLLVNVSKRCDQGASKGDMTCNPAPLKTQTILHCFKAKKKKKKKKLSIEDDSRGKICTLLSPYE
jgi:hypothetical protein